MQVSNDWLRFKMAGKLARVLVDNKRTDERNHGNANNLQRSIENNSMAFKVERRERKAGNISSVCQIAKS